MITIYLKQSYNLLKENRFVNGISIAGTALSVAAVMLIYLVYQVNFSAYAPESNRYRILFVSSLQACGSDGHPINNGGMSHKVVRECLYPLQTPEAVTAFTSGDLPVNVHGQQFYDKYAIKFTDDGFWKVSILLSWPAVLLHIPIGSRAYARQSFLTSWRADCSVLLRQWDKLCV